LILAAAGLTSLLLISGGSFNFSRFHWKSEARVIDSELSQPPPTICNKVDTLSGDSFTNSIGIGLSSPPELFTFAVSSDNLDADTPNTAVPRQGFVICSQDDSTPDIVEVHLTTGDIEPRHVIELPGEPVLYSCRRATMPALQQARRCKNKNVPQMIAATRKSR